MTRAKPDTALEAITGTGEVPTSPYRMHSPPAVVLHDRPDIINKTFRDIERVHVLYAGEGSRPLNHPPGRREANRREDQSKKRTPIHTWQPSLATKLVDLVGIEPTTSCLQSMRSPKVSYRPIVKEHHNRTWQGVSLWHQMPALGRNPPCLPYPALPCLTEPCPALPAAPCRAPPGRAPPPLAKPADRK